MNDDQPTYWPDIAVSDLIKLGIDCGYGDYKYQKENKMLSLFKKGTRLNIYYTTGTIGTCINHPTKGKTQLFRRNVTLLELDKIFQHPRVHTRKGYYKK